MDDNINKKRGERVREVLKEHGVTQELASKWLGYSDYRIVSMICRGARSLTYQKARILTEHFPEVRIEYLMGEDDFKTEEEQAEYFRKQGERVQIAFEEFFRKVVDRAGYCFEFKHLELDDFLNCEEQYIFSKDGVITGLSYFDKDGDIGIQSFWDDVIDYAAFRLSKIIQKKNGIEFKVVEDK